jgi:hypothetical protein
MDYFCIDCRDSREVRREDKAASDRIILISLEVILSMNSTSPTPAAPLKEPRDMRIRRLHFPNSDKLVFDKTKKGFVPLPILMRKAMKYLSAVELRVLVYFQTRCSQYSVCYPNLEEIAHDLDLAGTRNLTPHIKSLERKKFITTATRAGKKYFLVHDPAVAIAHLVEEGTISPRELVDINELLGDLGRYPIIAVPKPPVI